MHYLYNLGLASDGCHNSAFNFARSDAPKPI
eukprot:COSAG02_NODE_55993_length_287_cov_1.494681_1_plen_30_part_10